MGSKREEERNEKIIRGLMKLPPNRRCINCNSLGPQYVCTNFWTFICTTCSGLHREFTHRVKSVSMAKFTFQEVDALQKGGNQRARELFLKAWDPERNRLVDNSNIDKLRNFIKNVYVDKMYSMDKSSDRPPRDPQNLRSHEDETRRASSYHSYSQSPPYDFQYEERKYGKHAPSLTRKPGSDRGLYEGKLGGFFSPNRLSDYTSHERFENEGPHPRMSDYSGNGGVDLFASDILSPSSQKDIGSPFSNTSRDISREDPSLHKPDANSSKLHPRRTASVGSFGSSNSGSMSFKSVLSMSFPEVGTEPVLLAEASHEKSAAILSPPQSSVSGAYNGLDLFDTPFAPQNVSSAPPTAVNAIQQSPPSSVPSFFEQLPSQIAQPLPLDFFAAPSQQQSAPSSNGWATFDTPQNIVPIGTENSTPAAMPSSSNPFSIDQSSSYQAPASHETSASTFAFGLESLKTVETTNIWNAFDAAAEGHPTQNVVEIHRQAAMHSASNEEKSIGNGGYESLSSHGMITTSSESEPPSSSLSSQFNATLNDFPVASAMAGAESFATDQKPINPFDLPYDPNMESTNASQFWSMNSLQEALPNLQVPATYDDGLNAPWLPQNPASSFPPGGVSFDSTTGPLGFIAGQPPNPPIPSIHAQGPVASVGGNPFA